MTKEEKKLVIEHIIKTGGFEGKTKGSHSIESLIIMGEWNYYWFGEQYCKDMASWLQHIGLNLEIRNDDIKLSDESIVNYFQNVMGLQVAPLVFPD